MSAPLAELMTAGRFGRLPDEPLSPLPEWVVTEPVSWARIAGATAVGVVLALWTFGLAALYLAEWRGAA